MKVSLRQEYEVLSPEDRRFRLLEVTLEKLIASLEALLSPQTFQILQTYEPCPS